MFLQYMTLYDKYQIFISTHIIFIYIYIIIEINIDINLDIYIYIIRILDGYPFVKTPFLLVSRSPIQSPAGPGLLQATVQFKMLRYRIWRRDS